MTETSDKRKLNVLISGSNLSANKGAMAMTIVLAEQMREIAPNCTLTLLSKYYHQDLPQAEVYDIRLVDARPSRLITSTLLRNLLALCLRRVPAKWLTDSITKEYYEADVLIDLGGVTFSDDRDWKGLMLSLGFLAPAVATGTPIVKLSQAMGPFRKIINRYCAEFFLKRCRLLIARGKTTQENVKKLLGSDVECHECADVAFLLKPAENEQVSTFLCGHNMPEGNFIGVSPSAVVDRKARGKMMQEGYRKAMVELVDLAVKTTSLPVMLIPYAWPPGSRDREDMELCCEIYDKVSDKDNVYVITEDIDAVMLKGIIARSRAFVACRFHAMIAALSSKVPVMVIGWGHKYAEMMAQFGLGDYVYDFAFADSTILSESFSRMWNNRQELKEKLSANLPGVTESAERNFVLLRRFLQTNGLI